MAHLIQQSRLILCVSFAFMFSACFAFALAQSAQAATTAFSPAGQTITVGREFDVILRVDTQGQAINAVEGRVTYPASLMEGRTINTASSFITIWTEAPAFDAGTIRFSGGRPTPGFTGQGEVFRARFRASAAGTATMSLQNARILLNDGSGTNVFESAGTGVYTLQIAPPPPPPEPEPEPEPQPQPEPTSTPTPPSTGETPTPVTPPAPGEQAPAPSATTPAPIISVPAPIRAIFAPPPPPVVTTAQSVIEVAERILPAATAARVAETVTAIQESRAFKVVDARVINNPVVEEISVKVASPIVIATAAANVVAATNFANLILYLQAFFTQPFLFLARRRRKEWGQVYSSLTKLPVDLALVRLYESATGRLVRTRVTDREGRYLFLADPGAYKLEVNKAGFNFPSDLLKGKESDVDFTNLYHGGPLAVSEKNTTIAKTIPLDPIEQDETPRSVIWRQRKRKLQKTMAWSGPVLAMGVVIIQPTPMTVGLLGLQFGLLGVFKRLAHGRVPRSWATVKDARTGRPISYAVARIFDTQFNKLLDTQVTDSYGRYAFLVGKGQFYITIDKPGYTAYKSEPLDLTRGGLSDIVKRDIALKPAEDKSGSQPPLPPAAPSSLTPVAPASAPPAPPAGAVGVPTVQNPSQADLPAQAGLPNEETKT